MFRYSACLLNKTRTLLLSLQAVLDVSDAPAGLPQHLRQKQWTTSMQRVAFSTDLSSSSIDCFSFSHARAYVMRCLMRRGTAAMPGQQKSHLSAKRACKCLSRCKCEETLSNISFQVCTGPEAIVGSAERARRSRQQAGFRAMSEALEVNSAERHCKENNGHMANGGSHELRRERSSGAPKRASRPERPGPRPERRVR